METASMVQDHADVARGPACITTATPTPTPAALASSAAEARPSAQEDRVRDPPRNASDDLGTLEHPIRPSTVVAAVPPISPNAASADKHAPIPGAYPTAPATPIAGTASTLTTPPSTTSMPALHSGTTLMASPPTPTPTPAPDLAQPTPAEDTKTKRPSLKIGGPETPAFVPSGMLSLHQAWKHFDLKNDQADIAVASEPFDTGRATEPSQDLLDEYEAWPSGTDSEELLEAPSGIEDVGNSPPKGEPAACLFVASLNAQRTDEQLTESVTRHFSRWGSIMNIKVMKDWQNRPYAFVQYYDVENAKRALEESHDTVVDGRHIRVEQARVNRTLCLTKLPKNLTDDCLRAYLRRWGHVENVHLVYNARGRPKGCGFAKFRYREDAIRAYLHIRQQGKWGVEWAANNDRQTGEVDRHSIFIGQLNPTRITQNILESRFSQYGTIDSVNLVNKEGEAFAFIRFDDEDGAQNAINGENGKEFLERIIKVQFREVPDFRPSKTRSAPSTFRNQLNHRGLPLHAGAPDRGLSRGNFYRGKLPQSSPFHSSSYMFPGAEFQVHPVAGARPFLPTPPTAYDYSRQQYRPYPGGPYSPFAEHVGAPDPRPHYHEGAGSSVPANLSGPMPPTAGVDMGPGAYPHGPIPPYPGMNRPRISTHEGGAMHHPVVPWYPCHGLPPPSAFPTLTESTEIPPPKPHLQAYPNVGNKPRMIPPPPGAPASVTAHRGGSPALNSSSPQPARAVHGTGS